MERVRQRKPGAEARLARDRRDASLDRLSRVTGKIALAVVALVVALGLYISRALPGHHAAPSVSSESGSTASGAAPTAPTSQSQSGTPSIAPPTSPPINTSAPPQVATGAS
jgi:hypothetical protein